ncbi:MAG: cold-shock protein [Acidimicrobiales bacterium]
MEGSGPSTQGDPKAPHTGTVAAFDESRGLGTVADDDGTDRPFHCTAIVDGSRRIPVGARVLFTLAPGHLGRLEAHTLMPIG